jgi:hypothetical protein
MTELPNWAKPRWRVEVYFRSLRTVQQGQGDRLVETRQFRFWWNAWMWARTQNLTDSFRSSRAKIRRV